MLIPRLLVRHGQPPCVAAHRAIGQIALCEELTCTWGVLPTNIRPMTRLTGAASKPLYGAALLMLGNADRTFRSRSRRAGQGV